MKKILVVLLVASTFCHATTNLLEFDYGRGSPRGSYRFGDFIKQEGPRGPQWSADFLHKKSERGYVGLGGGHFHSGDEVSDSLIPGATSSRILKMTSILVLGRVDLSANPRLTPYLLLGAGWVRNSLTVVGSPTTSWPDTGTSESRVLVDDSKSTLGYTAGLGLDLALSDKMFVGVDARYQGSVKRSFDTTPAGQTATGQTQINVPLGAFLLGAKVGIKY